MNILTIFTASLLVGLAATVPVSDDNIVINAEIFFTDDFAIYTAEHDIYNLVVPLNALNFGDDDDESSAEENGSSINLFFVQADTDDTGKIDYKGLYVLNNGKATKLLDNGRDAAADNDDTKLVYLAATDGLYVYDAEKKKAVKYGTLTDNFIAIAKENSSNVLFVINDKFEMYKVTEEGKKMEKLNEVENAQQLVLDYSDNIYYYGEDKVVYVINGESKVKISGLPKNPSYIQLLTPPFVFDECVPLIVNDKAYIVYANGTSELTEFRVQDRPTGYAMEATLIQYYAYNKKIYAFNFLQVILYDILEELKEFLEDKKEEIQSIATRSRSTLRL